MSRTVLFISSVLLLLSVVSAASLHFTVTPSQQAYLNELHHPDTQHLARNMETVFLELDTNADGELNDEEMQEHEHSGMMSATERVLMHTFDLDNSGSVSLAEFTLAPHTLNFIETAAEVESPFAETSEMQSAEAAFEGLDTPRAPVRRLKSRIPTNEVDFNVLSELSASIRQEPDAAAPTDAAAAPAADPSAAGAAPAAAADASATTASGRVKKTKRNGAPLPVSLFGVPSVADEECVMCLYFVQRIQNGVADRLENGPNAQGSSDPPAGGAGLAGATAAAQKALHVRNTNSQLQKKPGGRGIVRVIAEDVMAALCAVDKMPLLFNPYCSGFTEANTINAVRKGVFFNIPTVEVCSQAALCRDDSYINTNAAVHATKTSLFLNGQRGICGMLGGSKDRPTSRENLLINAVCNAHGVVFGEQ